MRMFSASQVLALRMGKATPPLSLPRHIYEHAHLSRYMAFRYNSVSIMYSWESPKRQNQAMVSCKGSFVSEQFCSFKGSNVSSRLRRLYMQIQAKFANIFRRTLFLKLKVPYLFSTGDVPTSLAFEIFKLHSR